MRYKILPKLWKTVKIIPPKGALESVLADSKVPPDEISQISILFHHLPKIFHKIQS